MMRAALRRLLADIEALPTLSRDQLLYERARLTQLATRRTLTRVEAALLDLFVADLAGYDEEMLAHLTLCACRALERDINDAALGARPCED
jgi:hypothetical protein